MQVGKRSNSLTVRLPAAVVEALQLTEADEIDVAGWRTFGIAPDATGILARLRRFRGRLPAGFKFDRFEANVRQIAPRLQ